MKLTDISIKNASEFITPERIATVYDKFICETYLKVCDTLQIKITGVNRRLSLINFMVHIKSSDSKYYINTTDLKQYGKRLGKVMVLHIMDLFERKLSKKQKDIVKNIVATDWEINILSKSCVCEKCSDFNINEDSI